MRLDVIRRTLGPLLIALAATLATLNTLGPGAGGPGITCDEGYRVAKGKLLVMAFRHQGLAFFRLSNIRANFSRQPDGLPMEPPLGHWILGWAHHLFDTAPDEPGVSIIAARFAPALGFGLLVFLVGLWTTRAEGPLAGTAAAAAVLLVPRLFAHAHLAALDMLTALFFVAAVLAVAEAAARGGRWWQFALAGIVWGLAMLVRLHGVLVLPPVLLWLAWHLGRRAWPSAISYIAVGGMRGCHTPPPQAGVAALLWRLAPRVILPMVVWVTAGLVTLFAGWPWLWLAPIGHLKQFLASGAGRPAVNVFYAGRVWADRDAPWHYPVVMFVVALPLGLLILGLLGTWARRRGWKAEPHLALIAGTWLFMLAVFSWPGVPVYDGVRLFLMVFPLWAVWVGLGAKWLVEHPAMPALSRRLRLLGLGLFLLLQGTGLVLYHPCQLSHYSLLVGGLWGAERLGFEVSYWGDAVREPLLQEAAARSQGRPILFEPHLAPWQARAVSISSPALQPALREGRVPLAGWDPNDRALALDCRYAVIYHRRANPDRVQWVLQRGRVVEEAEYQKQGVWLARLVEFPGPLGQQESPASATSVPTFPEAKGVRPRGGRR